MKKFVQNTIIKIMTVAGTGHRLKYAEKKRRKIINLYELWKKN